MPSLRGRKRSLERFAQVWIRKVRTPVVFVFDQFEQYFLDQQPSEATDFEIDLARIVNRRDLGAHVLITIREDAYFQLNRLRARIPHILAHSVKLDHLDERSGREAIEEPLRVWLDEHGPGAGPTSVSPEVVDRLIRQVSRTGSRNVVTAFLQLALKRLWEEERRHGSPQLRLETLKALGDASGIAKVHFEDTMKALADDERRLCAAIFDRMVTPSGMKIALPAADLKEDPQRVLSVLKKLAEGPSRIIQCVPSPKDDQPPLFEIFHDVLARPILDWIAAERERIQHQEKLEEQRREAEQQHARQQREIEWQQQQLAREKKLKRRYIVSTIFTLICLVVSVALAWIAAIHYQAAAKQKGDLLAAKAESALDDGDGRTGILLALEALPDHSAWLDDLGPLKYALDWLKYPDLLNDAGPRLPALDRALQLPLGQLLASKDDPPRELQDDQKPSPGGRLTLAAFSPDGHVIVTGSDTGMIQLWRVQELAEVMAEVWKTLKPNDDHDNQPSVNSATFDHDGGVLVTTRADGRAYIWDVKTGEKYTEWKADPKQNQTFAAISRDAELIGTDSYLIATASYGDNEKPQLWHWDRRDPEKSPEPRPPWGSSHTSGITSLAFDESGERLVTTSWDNTARVWRVRTASCFSRYATDARFPPTSARTASASSPHPRTRRRAFGR